MCRVHFAHVLLILALAAQLVFWTQTKTILPQMTIVPPVPGKIEVQALSFGDPQFYFRSQALALQNCGDTFGRFSPLYRYDYAKLRAWFGLLDSIDNRSDLVPAMAAYYYSQTQKREDTRYIVDYLYSHALARPERKWWWLVQATYLANHRLGDKNLAMKVAAPLATARTIPLWAQQMPAFIHEQRGEFAEALAIMEAIERDAKHIPPGELRFMRYFVEERLHALDNARAFHERKP